MSSGLLVGGLESGSWAVATPSRNKVGREEAELECDADDDDLWEDCCPLDANREWSPLSSIADESGAGEVMAAVVRVDELSVVVLQVRSRLPGAGDTGDETPKRVRATLGGITARRLAAHRRLMAAISAPVGLSLFAVAG